MSRQLPDAVAVPPSPRHDVVQQTQPADTAIQRGTIVQLRGGDPRHWLVREVVDGPPAQRALVRVEPGFEGSGLEQWVYSAQLVGYEDDSMPRLVEGIVTHIPSD